MADIEKVKQGLRNCDCRKTNCDGCSYRYGGLCADNITDCTGDLASDALSVIEELQAEIEQMKAQKRKWLQNIADQQLAVSPTGYETEEGLAKRTGEWNGLQMAWEILTKE